MSILAEIRIDFDDHITKEEFKKVRERLENLDHSFDLIGHFHYDEEATLEYEIRIWEIDDRLRDKEITREIWKALGRCVPLGIITRWIEQTPTDENYFNKEDYEEIMEDEE